jgi:nitrogen fixation negative regulator NifL
MNTNGADAIIAGLKSEIVELRKQNEAYRHLASFPELNPVVILEFNRRGELTYCNQAAQSILLQMGISDEKVFLPDDFDTIFTNVKQKQVLQSFKEIRIKDRIFDKTILYSPEYDVIRVYASEITRRKQAEEALVTKQQELTQTQRLLEAVTHGTDTIIATIDTQYCYTYFNPAYQEEVKRLSGNDISIGMNILDAFTGQPELQGIIRREWSQVLSGQATDKVLPFGDPGSYQQIYKVLHAPIYDSDGNVSGAGEVAYNITEQVHAQEALRESEERYRTLFQSMTEGFAIHEIILDERGKPVDYRFLAINPAFERLTGLRGADILGKTYRQVLPAEGDSWVNAYGNVVLTGEPAEFEQHSATLSRCYQVFAYRCAPNQFATIFLDITPHKQMEEELKINLTKYAVLFDAFPLGITVSDRSGQILESNQEAARLLGLPEEEHKQRQIGGKEWKVVRPDKSPMPPQEYASVRALQEQHRVENVEMGIVKDGGQITWISVTASPLPLEGYGVVITYNDISKRIQAEEQLRQVLERLEITVQERTQELLETNEDLTKEIIERKRVEAELLAQTQAVVAERKRFNDVLEILPAYTVLLTGDYHVSFANRYFRERFGDDQGRHCYEYLFGLDEPCPNCETYKVMKTGKDHNWEWRGPDTHIYDVFDFPFKDADGSKMILELGIDITTRKQAEEQLRSLNAYNRSLVEANLDALLTITADGKIGDVNSVTEAITGYHRDDLIGQEFHNYFTEPAKARSGYQRVFETGALHDYELEIQHRDGHTTPVTYNASLYRDESGRVAGVLAAARDITERKRAERQLVLLTTALEAAANGIILVDKDGTILWANSAFTQMTGYTQGEIVGKNLRMLKSGEQDQEFYENLWDTILEGKVWRGELANRRKDGSLYYEDQTITPVFDQNGNITNFISIRQDITERKQAEQALKKSEQQYRSLVKATAQIVWQTNAAGEVDEDNPIWRAYTGQSLEEYMGQGWLEVLHPDDQSRVAEIWGRAVETQSFYETECRIKNRSGQYGDFELRGVPINDKDGKILSWVGTCTNISEKKNFENQLIQAEKHAAIGRMVGSVTHEINNPLQTVKNCLYLIRQDLADDSPNMEPVQMALSETQRLSNIVGQLRQLYRPQASQVKAPHDLLEILEEVHGLITPHLNTSHVTWQPLPSLKSYRVNVIRDQIIEVLLNISMNAMEAMQPSGGILSVDMIQSTDQQQVGLVLRDTGPGIEPDILAHIFEPFMTTKEFGLGLGLSICYDIIQKHDGQITIDSQLGQGTSFTIWLPTTS